MLNLSDLNSAGQLHVSMLVFAGKVFEYVGPNNLKLNSLDQIIVFEYVYMLLLNNRQRSLEYKQNGVRF